MNKIEACVFYPDLPTTPKYRNEWKAFTTLCRVLEEAGVEVTPEQYGMRLGTVNTPFEAGCALWDESIGVIQYYSFMDVVEMLTMDGKIQIKAYNSLKQKRQNLYDGIKEERDEWLRRVSK